jgi:cytochrome c oxidase subunit 1
MILLAVLAWGVLWLIKRKRGRRGFTTEDWFLAASFYWCLVMVCQMLYVGNSTLDIQVHDTYFVIAHTYIFGFWFILFGVFALIYGFAQRRGRPLGPWLGKVHFWISFLCCFVLLYFPALHVEGLRRIPRRYLDFSSGSSWYYLDGFWQPIILAFIAAQVVFLGNFIYSTIVTKKT